MQALRRNWAIIAVTLGLIVIFLILYAFRGIFVPFLLGLFLAYLFMPLISWVERKTAYRGKHREARRVMLTLIIYLVVLGLIGLLLYYTVTTLISSISGIIQNAPGYTSDALLKIQDWISSFRKNVPPEFQSQVDQFLTDVGAALGNAVKTALMNSISLIPSSVGLILGFAALPIFLFYLLKDWERFGRGFYSGLPVGMANHARNLSSIIGRTVGRYVRATLLLAVILGVLNLIGFSILKVPFAPMLALLTVATSLIPTAGPWIGGAGVVIVTLATAPDKTLWVIVIMVISQVLQDYVLGPKIQGATLNIHPAIILILLIFGTSVAGFWGIVFIVPLAATIYRNLQVRSEGHFRNEQLARPHFL